MTDDMPIEEPESEAPDDASGTERKLNSESDPGAASGTERKLDSESDPDAAARAEGKLDSESDPGAGGESLLEEIDAETQAGAQSRKRLMVNGVLGVGVLAVLLIAGVGIGGSLVYNSVTQPRPEGPLENFIVPEGASGNRIGKLLADEGFVENQWFFRLALRVEPPREPIQFGAYRLPTGVSPVQLIDVFEAGPIIAVDPDAVRITIPEGLTIRQIGEQIGDVEGFTKAAADIDAAAILGFAVPSIEGFLMPNTYFFDADPDYETIIREMLEQFRRDFEPLREEFPEQVETDVIALLAVASLVEEEARADEERPIIASVIYNRLERGRSLDMDSTLQYALNKYGQRLLSEDKQVDSPYNTYKNAGLPPGPISNPGLASIRAAFDPAETDFLYFVSNADGKTHTFSKSLAEHNQAVARYRREIRKQRREEAQQSQ